MAIAAAATATVTMALARPTSNVLLTRHRARWVFTPFAVSSSFTSSSSSSKPSRALILYSKPGCCLCDGLKEKLQAAFLLAGPDSLQDVDLQIRDITGNPEWERAYQYEIPVLARVLSDGTEETLPRLPPRLGVELVQKKIAAALKH
ncbi:hypothetical protein PRUPE_1G500700 [Prunus persica]|nr:uncharacterized protein LOC18789548 [Prunus persica]XP_034198923.1 uncharacterized protein LOC117614276 isoform X1 [Prunus dulcis]ONI34816.1 hypothetical protein PRUPE_1G500700 [Prunus persica]